MSATSELFFTAFNLTLKLLFFPIVPSVYQVSVMHSPALCNREIDYLLSIFNIFNIAKALIKV